MKLVHEGLCPGLLAPLGRGGAAVGEQLFNRAAGQIGGRFQGLVQIGHVSGVVLAVMDLHGRGVDGGIERVVRVGQRSQFKCHS